MLRRPSRKVLFTDAIASRFALWIINRMEPPDPAGIRELEEERRRHLLKMKLSIGIAASMGVGMVMIAPEWALFIVLAILLLTAPKLWELRRETLATAVLFEPAEQVEGLPAEIEGARQRSPAVEAYYQAVVEQGRPVMRIEALAMVAVPDLREEDWIEEMA